VLHEVTEEGGLGFCHVALPEVLPYGFHGPLIVALDSNILIDLQEHGRALLDGQVPDAAGEYAKELLALGSLIDIWMIRDIRFVVTPRSRTDAKRFTTRFSAGRALAIDALAESLAFQYGDWIVAAPSDLDGLPSGGRVAGLPEGADRDLVAEAQSVGAHVFLTRDRGILDRAVVKGAGLAIMSPISLMMQMDRAGVQLIAGGVCGQKACPYWGLSTLGDIGKWNGLLSLFEDD